jgi:hypothetical protein
MTAAHVASATGPDRQERTIVPVRRVSAGAHEVGEVLERGLRIGVGTASLATALVFGALDRSLQGDRDRPHGRGSPPSGLPLLVGAALGLTVEAARLGIRAMGAMTAAAEPFLSAGSLFVPGLDALDRRSARLNRVWLIERSRNEETATAFAYALMPELVSTMLDQLDLTELVRERVDLDRIVQDVDIDAIAARIDLDPILERVDVDAIAAALDVDEVVARVDLDRVVDRVDVQAVASRVDVEALVSRMDLGAIASRVLDELDIPAIVRGSTGAMATETVDGIRLQGMNADRLVARLVNRTLRRSDPGAPPVPPAPVGEPGR